MPASPFLPFDQPAQLTESGLQSRCHVWFNKQYPDYRGLGYMNHNDGAKNQIQAAQDTARGLVKGIPDWFLAKPMPAPNGEQWFGDRCFPLIYHGLYIEFKVGRNKPDPMQLKRIAQLRAQGYRVEVVYTESEFQRILTEYLA